MLPFFSFFAFSFLLISPVFPARILPDSVATRDIHNAKWHSFTKFVDASKGDNVAGMSQLKKYFNRFGYLPIPDMKILSDTFDTQFESAVIAYQTNLGLPATGKLDSDTVSLIMSPRCGVGDAERNPTNRGFHVTKQFAYFHGTPRWTRKSPATLTYAFTPNSMIDYISPSEIRAVFSRAFSRWARVIPVSFSEVDDHETADIQIGFHRGDHGDVRPFDGVFGVLAHAFSLPNGRVHLDAAETWAVDFDEVKGRTAVDLESVATHEIGHVLGLAHSSVKEAVMYPSLSPRRKRVELTMDDVVGIQAIYGSNPNFRWSSFLESENFSNSGGGSRRKTSRVSKLTISLVVAVLILLWCAFI